MTFEDLLGDSALFRKSDSDWKLKRPIMAHAFYKNRLEKMMDVLKGKLTAFVNKWNFEIENSPDGKIVIDIA